MKYSGSKVWQKSMDLVDELYSASDQFPATERFGISSQLQRAAVSIPSNIAEGHGRKSTNAFLNHLSIAFADGPDRENAERIEKVTEMTRCANCLLLALQSRF
ncbi:MAG: four helix bundle protein [Betaproteobacteria bacterium]|nr:four helix bundle protein [Betaproteobacteria bacterium]